MKLFREHLTLLIAYVEKIATFPCMQEEMEEMMATNDFKLLRRIKVELDKDLPDCEIMMRILYLVEMSKGEQ